MNPDQNPPEWIFHHGNAHWNLFWGLWIVDVLRRFFRLQINGYFSKHYFYLCFGIFIIELLFEKKGQSDAAQPFKAAGFKK